MPEDAVITRREMKNYDKHHMFAPTEKLRLYAIADGAENLAPKGRPVCPMDYFKQGFFKKAPKSFYVVEVYDEPIEMVFPCARFGLSDGVVVKFHMETRSRSASIMLFNEHARKEDVGDEEVSYLDMDGLYEYLKDSFAEAVDKVHGNIDDAYFVKLAETASRTGNFIDNLIVVDEVRKYEQ